MFRTYCHCFHLRAKLIHLLLGCYEDRVENLYRDLSGGTNGKMVELSPKAPQTESSKPNERFVDKLLHVRTLHYMSDKLLRNLFISLINLEQQVTFESHLKVNNKNVFIQL